jgi:uncharacterized protein with FMN-binding domain
MKSPITKYLIGGVIVAAFAAYAIFSSNQNNSSAILPSSSPSNTTPSSSSPSSSSTGTQTSGLAAGTPQTTTGTYKDGTYTGAVADAFYGNLQVVAVIQSGNLTDVQFPVYPNNGGHTSQLSKTDLPILKQEAIAAQSAKVNIVSGATQLSQAFAQSLTAALAQAK